jgi:sarcosine oxidase delta subunit
MRCSNESGFAEHTWQVVAGCVRFVKEVCRKKSRSKDSDLKAQRSNPA